MTEIKQVVENIVYKSSDGRIFDSRIDCEIWESYLGKTLYDILENKVIGDPEFIEGLKNNIIIKGKYFIIYNNTFLQSRYENEFLISINDGFSFLDQIDKGAYLCYVHEDAGIVHIIGDVHVLEYELERDLYRINSMIEGLEISSKLFGIIHNLTPNEKLNFDNIHGSEYTINDILKKAETLPGLIKSIKSEDK